MKYLFTFLLLAPLLGLAQTVTITSVTPTPVCAGSGITVAYSYTLNDAGNVILYLNGPSTTNLQIGAATTNGGNGVVLGTIPTDRQTGTYTVFIRRISNTLPNPVNSPNSGGFTVNALPSAPGVSNVSYCQGAAAQPLTATGQNLKFYTQAQNGTGYASLTPPTSSTGIMNYYVSQTVNNCESPRATLAVTVNATPAPGVSNLSYCQGTSSVASLSATGQNLKYYTQASGGTAYSSLTPSTSTTGVTNYYISQTVNGCESPRAILSVSVAPCNVLLGPEAGSALTTGGFNTFIGERTGLANTTGNYNTLLGYQANMQSANLQNSVAIGANAKVALNNAIVLGDPTNTSIAVGIGTDSPQFPLDVRGTINLRNNGRIKFAHLSNPIHQGTTDQFLTVNEQGETELARYRISIDNVNQWSDKVFSPTYQLKPLAQVEQYIQQNNHLPDVPSAEQVKTDGVDLVKMNALLLQKVEELTLYSIEMKKEIEELKKQFIKPKKYKVRHNNNRKI